MLNPSVYADTTNTKAFEDITPKMVNNIYYINNGYQIDIEDLSKIMSLSLKENIQKMRTY